ncbi:MAG: cellulase family glycosylhydrolase [Oscillospiraceae bacterium]|nr:cellulase family glycosylhydrolase [Oscillospiraceae bacterium]
MRWTEEKANNWQKETGWLFGFNYVASTAVNSTEMWQRETYDKETIKRELAIGAKTGYNSCRVFLQYIVWENERDGFLETFGDFCEIARANGISVMPILFDDCAFAGKEPYLGAQTPPVPGIHNSGWTPSPGNLIADNPEKEQVISDYAKNVIGAFGSHGNIAAWDLYNEPGNNGRREKCLPLLKKAFSWARDANPTQPLTAGIWEFREYDLKFADMSDIITYHDYAPIENSKEKINELKKYNRPVICTEWLLRQHGNKFESHMPLFAGEIAGAYNWGLIKGKTQTNLHWGSKLNDPEPEIWQHDLYHSDGTPYSAAEIEFIKNMKNLAKNSKINLS